MTLLQLHYFREVCRQKNMTKAAKSLHISQPSISNAIRELEAELGVQLFYRIKMRLTLTQEGEYFLNEAVRILDDIDRLTQRMQDLGGKRNLVRMGIPPMIGVLIFPQMLASFQKIYPGIRVEVSEWGSLDCRDQVLDETLDLAITITNGLDTSKLSVLPIHETRLVFCVQKDHPLARKETVDIQDIKDMPLVLLPQGSYNRVLAESLYTENGLVPNVLIHSSQLYTIERLLQNRAAGAFLFEEFAKQTSDIVGIPTAPPFPAIQVGVIWKKDKLLYGDAIKFVNFAKKHSLEL